MKQTIEIEVPEGKKAVWKDGKVVFEDIKLQLPKTWEEYYKLNYPTNNTEYFIGTNSGIVPYKKEKRVFSRFERNLLASEEDAKAHLALMQLHRLRDYYRQGWKPDWKNTKVDKYCVVNCEGLFITSYTTYVRFLSFQSEEIATEFLNNFRDLIEQAMDLI